MFKIGTEVLIKRTKEKGKIIDEYIGSKVFGSNERNHLFKVKLKRGYDFFYAEYMKEI